LVGDLICIVIQTVVMRYEAELASRYPKCLGVSFAFHRSPNRTAIHLPQAEPHPRPPEKIPRVPVTVIHHVDRTTSAKILQSGEGQTFQRADRNHDIKIRSLMKELPGTPQLQHSAQQIAFLEHPSGSSTLPHFA